MQRAVRAELGRFGNSEDAIVLENNERQTIQRVWELWLALDLPVEVGEPHAAQYVENWLGGRIAKLIRKLRKHAAANGVRILMRGTENPIEKDIWIVAQIADPRNLSDALKRIERSIGRVLHDQTEIAVECYQRRWNSLHIVPIVNGRTMLHLAVQAHIASYCLSRTVNFFPYQVDDEVLTNLGVPRWDSEVARHAEVLSLAAQALKQSVDRLVEVDGAPCDESARDVVDAHRRNWQAEWLADTNRAVAAANWLADAVLHGWLLVDASPPDEARAAFVAIADCISSVQALEPTGFHALDLQQIVGPFVEQIDAITTYVILSMSARDPAPFGGEP